MKTSHLIIAAIAAAGAIGTLPAAEAPADEARVLDTFVNPEKFADVGDGYMSTDKGREANVEAIREHIEKTAVRYLPEGHKLAVSITDIDLAGDFEPWHKPGAEDVRIIKDIYPPRVDLEYKVTDAAGAVVKEGKRQLRDLSFMMKLSIRRDDMHRYEKELLNDWMRSDLGPKLAQR
jgi:hypothetical protein